MEHQSVKNDNPLENGPEGAVPGRYRHYKGNYYEVIGTACHSETGEKLVVYRCLYGDGSLWVRPLDMFMESVTVDGRKVPRFVRCEKE
ncbi:MAG TPA: DUF1653 domain-containing protein [Geobacteraceae bacterium]|nr:DUF1653 domain-containing protein [Geobacteraceae bacterium]